MNCLYYFMPTHKIINLSVFIVSQLWVKPIARYMAICQWHNATFNDILSNSLSCTNEKKKNWMKRNHFRLPQWDYGLNFIV